MELILHVIGNELEHCVKTQSRLHLDSDYRLYACLHEKFAANRVNGDPLLPRVPIKAFIDRAGHRTELACNSEQIPAFAIKASHAIELVGRAGTVWNRDVCLFLSKHSGYLIPEWF